MIIINTRNAHQALPEAIRRLSLLGYERPSRAGDVVMFTEPVTTHYTRPRERVVFWPERDANPYFHLMEGLWMLAGRNDVAFVEQYVRRMRGFSDDGITLHGAYGHRWRNHFSYDQLRWARERLVNDPNDRRVVISMWDGDNDPERADEGGRDVPCNTHLYLSINVEGRLDMTVCCRSNDLIWGAYGANAVHFSMLQEFMASWIGVGVGGYWQVSNNLHAYKDVLRPMQLLMDRSPSGLDDPQKHCLYHTQPGLIRPYDMVSLPGGEWLEELEILLEEGPVIGLRDRFLRQVAVPIMVSHRAYRYGVGLSRYDEAQEAVSQCMAMDWRVACQQWLERRRDGFLKKGTK